MIMEMPIFSWLNPLSYHKPVQSKAFSFYVALSCRTTAFRNLRCSGPGGGIPGTKKAESAVITPVVGWNKVNVITPVALSAGAYWLAYLPSSNGLAFSPSREQLLDGKILFI